ncbi:hypothetical protein [Sulfuricurvum sp.]|uniref:hypothetical protein n=1 Tax=Sulfuricurvum sp. TaxID=2025608 RepID=UPI00260A67EC|nr:hypothetical protein [Sulfuricurvum sp.]MDD3595213.1 hypothetical protein [Sulfuricurvum sp.]
MCTQAKDTIRYNNQDMAICAAKEEGQESGTLSPLYVLKEKRGITLNPIQANTGNYRGYTCRWEVIGDTLYLTRFNSKSFRIYTFDQFMGITPPDEANAISGEKLYPPDEVHVKAEWFSGVIVARAYRTQNTEEKNGWELRFEHGRLVGAVERHVWSPKRLKDYIEEE